MQSLPVLLEGWGMAERDWLLWHSHESGLAAEHFLMWLGLVYLDLAVVLLVSHESSVQITPHISDFSRLAPVAAARQFSHRNLQSLGIRADSLEQHACDESGEGHLARAGCESKFKLTYMTRDCRTTIQFLNLQFWQRNLRTGAQTLLGFRGHYLSKATPSSCRCKPDIPAVMRIIRATVRYNRYSGACASYLAIVVYSQISGQSSYKRNMIQYLQS